MIVALIDGLKVQRLLVGAPGKEKEQRRACREFVRSALARNGKRAARGK